MKKNIENSAIAISRPVMLIPRIVRMRKMPGNGTSGAFVPVTIAAVTGTEPDEAGLASGLINTSQQVGGALGLAIAATVANSTTADAFASGEANRLIALNEGFQDAFLVCAGFGILGAILAATMISSRDSREHAEAAQRGEVDAVPAS